MNHLKSTQWFLLSVAACAVLADAIPLAQTSRQALQSRQDGDSWFRSLLGKVSQTLLATRPDPLETRVALKVPLDAPTRFDKFIGEITFCSRGFSTRPILKDGVISGMRVAMSNPDHPLYRLGLRDGDIVQRLNDNNLDGAESLSSTYYTMRASPELRFEVERDGKLVVIHARILESGEAEHEVASCRELVDRLHPPHYLAGQGFRMKPVLREGEIVGMRLTVENVAHPIYRLGLRTNDVVLGVNGTPTNGPESLSNIYREIHKGSVIQFKIERAGKIETLVVELEQ